MNKTDFDEYADEYNSILQNQLNFFSNDNNYFAEYKVLKLKELLKKQPRTILDFGCGIGRSSVYLKKHFPDTEVYGCDISEKSLTSARKLAPDVNFYSIDKMQELNMTFDLVFIAGVFHHIEPGQREAVLKTISTFCQKGSYIAVFEHNPLNPVTRYLVKTCPFDRDAVLLKPKELKELFSQNGLKQITCHYTLFFPSWLKWMRFLERYLRLIPFGGQYVISGIL